MTTGGWVDDDIPDAIEFEDDDDDESGFGGPNLP
jgi:hypothetical protein